MAIDGGWAGSPLGVGQKGAATPDQPSDLDEVLHFLSTIGFQGRELREKNLRVFPAECLLVIHAHLLPSTLPLLIRLTELGFPAQQILIIPKPYSLVPYASLLAASLGVRISTPPTGGFPPGHYDQYSAKLLWEGCREAADILSAEKCKRVILVDDGGLLTQWWGRWCRAIGQSARNAISIQQTASGFSETRLKYSNIVKIDIARSAAKKYFESPIIAEGILRCVDSLNILDDGSRIGIAGMGSLGGKLARRLAVRGQSRKYILHCYSRITRAKVPLPVRVVSSGSDLVRQCDVIFGCTGKNWFDVELPEHWGPKTFVSCSSRDIEFQHLLTSTNRRPLPDLYSSRNVSRSGRVEQVVLNGGFPINFDRRTEWERPSEIAITRGLVLSAILQSLTIETGRNTGWRKVVKLLPKLQKRLVLDWLDFSKLDVEYFGVTQADILPEAWWERNSFS